MLASVMVSAWCSARRLEGAVVGGDVWAPWGPARRRAVAVKVGACEAPEGVVVRLGASQFREKRAKLTMSMLRLGCSRRCWTVGS